MNDEFIITEEDVNDKIHNQFDLFKRDRKKFFFMQLEAGKWIAEKNQSVTQLPHFYKTLVGRDVRENLNAEEILREELKESLSL